jgi:hypothetical protein
VTTNFISNLVNNQIINVDLYLSRNERFTWSFYKTYYESCVPQNQNKPSAGCGCPKPQFNCNHVRVSGQLQNGGACQDAASYCEPNPGTIIGNSNINCPNKNNQDVVLSHTESSHDKSLSRVISLKYKRVDDTIIKI